jgi:uncharacterized protein (TIGR02246 family)
MKRVHYSLLLAFVAIGFAVLSASPVPQGSSGDELAIRKIDAAWSHAAETNDLNNVVSVYADDGSLLPFNAPVATGTAAIRQVWSSLMSAPGYSLTFSPTKIVVAASRDTAWEIGTFELKLNNSEGSPATIPGKYVVTWTQVGGSWKVAADIFNTNH